MNFYGYKGKNPLGQEPLGSDNRIIWRDVKNIRSAMNRAKKLWGENFKLYHFTNFQDNNTFKEIV